MSLLTTQPVNNNFLSPLGYKIYLSKLPTTNFFIQSVQVPSVKLPPATMNTPFVQIPFPGDHLKFSPLVITFKMDEALQAYTDIFGWMQALGFPESFDQYEQGTRPSNPRLSKSRDTTSDAVLTVLSSAMNPIFQYNFKHIYPSDIGSFKFDSRDGEVNYITVDVEFMYAYFTVTRDSSELST